MYFCELNHNERNLNKQFELVVFLYDSLFVQKSVANFIFHVYGINDKEYAFGNKG